MEHETRALLFLSGCDPMSHVICRTAGSLCVAPVPRSALGLTCKPEKLSFRIDSMAEKSWPLAESLKIDGLDVSVKHRVVVTCGG
jgi:hypothetical protein